MDEFTKRWRFVRSETLELLKSLSDDQLLFKPQGENWQPLYFQFGCIARTQLVYAEAAKSGVMDFTLFESAELPNKHDNKTQRSLVDLLESSDKRWFKALENNTGGVIWPDGKKSILLHIENLAEHERLHHGQLISCFTMAGIKLPTLFKGSWSL